MVGKISAQIRSIEVMSQEEEEKKKVLESLIRKPWRKDEAGSR